MDDFYSSPAKKPRLSEPNENIQVEDDNISTNIQIGCNVATLQETYEDHIIESELRYLNRECSMRDQMDHCYPPPEKKPRLSKPDENIQVKHNSMSTTIQSDFEVAMMTSAVNIPPHISSDVEMSNTNSNTSRAVPTGYPIRPTIGYCQICPSLARGKCAVCGLLYCTQLCYDVHKQHCPTWMILSKMDTERTKPNLS